MASTSHQRGRTRRSGLRCAAAILSCVAASAACSSGTDSTSSAARDAPAPVVQASPAEGVPAATLDDWVSYSDAVVVVSVRRERAEDVQGPAAPSEGYRPRTVTADVERIEWSHPSLPTPPDSLTYGTAGWVVHDGTESPMQYEGSVRVEVGGRYLMPIATNARGVLAPIAPSAVVRLDGEKVDADAEASTAKAALDGDGLGQVRAEIAAAVPDPVAEANRHLGPVARAQAVAAAGP
jgi:hypothetical protein